MRAEPSNHNPEGESSAFSGGIGGTVVPRPCWGKITPPDASGLTTGSMQSRRALAVLFSVVIIDLVGFGIVVPVLPFIIEDFDSSAGVLGLLVAS